MSNIDAAIDETQVLQRTLRELSELADAPRDRVMTFLTSRTVSEAQDDVGALGKIVRRLAQLSNNKEASARVMEYLTARFPMNGGAQ